MYFVDLAIAYGFESLIINEFQGRNFPCANFMPTGPAYDDAARENRVCVSVGAEPGSDFVSGDDYIESAFEYNSAHKWR